MRRTAAACVVITSSLDEDSGVQAEIIAGIVSSVAAALIIGAGAWGWQRCRVREKETPVKQDAPSNPQVVMEAPPPYKVYPAVRV